MPVLCTDDERGAALTALEILDAGIVLTIDSVKAAALGAGADLAEPLLVVDIGAHLTEVGLLVDGRVTHADRIEIGTLDLGRTTPVAHLVQSVVGVVTDLLQLDCGGQVVDALERGPLLTGGGALRPQITSQLAKRLLAPVRPAPAPHFAAVRGAGLALGSVGRHRSFTVACTVVTRPASAQHHGQVGQRHSGPTKEPERATLPWRCSGESSG
ncbi:rod shape-determining protein [Kribbella sp. NPDC005582]|uniref:rod shape-determining protein n=1 Tax=Kribbella sp. NPDC005582 TaxID=3156893 RepID=UPI0033B18898